MRVNGGADAQAASMAGELAGATGTSTATSSTTLTDSGATFGAYVGHVVAAAGVYGVVVSNTSTVLTVDRWSAPGTPGGSAGSTPGSTSSYVVLPGQAPYWFMALTANASAASATDTALTGEITTAGGGLIKKLGTYAHTTGVASYSLAATFTANGTDSLPVTVAKIGTFNSVVASTGRMQFETLLSATATLSASGDSLTCTQTVTM